MSKKDIHNLATKHIATDKPNAVIAADVQNLAVEGRISCANAFVAVENLHAESGEVGKTIDLLAIKICKCQLGLFGHDAGKFITPAQSVAPELKKAISANLVNGRLACFRAWEIARMLRISKMDVSSACEALGIRVKPCQLGAF